MNLFAPSVTDGYKLGHSEMYADGSTLVYSNLTPRSDKIYKRTATRFYDGKLVVIAEAPIAELHEIWEEFFNLPKDKAIARFKRRVDGYLGPDAINFDRMAKLHNLGFLPLCFKAMPEGSLVPMGIPVITVYNTLPGFFWLVNFNETLLSSLTWKIMTNATIAREYAAMGKHYGELTGVDDFTRSIQFHDFSARGMSGPEDAARAGLGHLTQFIGTDTLAAMDYAEDYYDCDGQLIAISVPATEHAVATSNILGIEDELVCKYEINDDNTRLVAEQAFMKDLITRKFPRGIVSYVADSFDFWGVLTEVLPGLKDVILARESSDVAPGKLVIRPDSGDPVKVICGYKAGEDGYWATADVGGEPLETPVFIDNDGNEVPEYEVKGAVELLWEIFGGTINDKGFKVLDSHIGLIYGDSITTKRAEQIFERLVAKGFSTGNVVFGVGSYTYQCNTRDTFGFAVKATYTEVGDVKIPIFKDPKTDSKKKSAKGLLSVRLVGDELKLYDDVSWTAESEDDNMLQIVYYNGQRMRTTKLSEIRERCKAQ